MLSNAVWLLILCVVLVILAAVFFYLLYQSKQEVEQKKQKDQLIDKREENLRSLSRQQDARLLMWAENNKNNPIAQYLFEKRNESQAAAILSVLDDSSHDMQTRADFRRILELLEQPELAPQLEVCLTLTLNELEITLQLLDQEINWLYSSSGEAQKQVHTAAYIAECLAKQAKLEERLSFIRSLLKRPALAI